MSEPGCIFCMIISGDIPSRKIYEDDHAYVFLDVRPWQRGHTLVVPKRHVVDVLEESDALTEIAPTAERVSRLLVDRLNADGLNLLSSARAVAGQEVFHLHLHLVPRYESQPGLAGLFKHEAVTDAELDAVLAEIVGAA